MSDQTINHLHPSVKELNTRLRKLRRILDHLDYVTHDQKRLIQGYKELIFQCTRLIETMDHVDVLVFEMRQELDRMGEG